MKNTNKSESGNIDFNPTFKSRRVSDFFTLAENDARLNLNGYKDPITMIVRDMETQMRKQEEAYLMETVREYGFDIDCEELKRALAYDRGQYIQGYRDAVEQYTRPKAEWLITNAYPHNVYCSNCHKTFAQTHWEIWQDKSLPRRFCPNCGAMMVEEDDNE